MYATFRDFKYTIYRTVISDIYVKEWLANMDKINDFVSWCQTLKKSSASFISSPRSRNLKVIKKCVHLKCICVWCLDSWSQILSCKPVNTFSMARLKILQLRLTLTPLFTATHAFIFLSYHFFSMICDWGIFFILVTLDLCLLLIHRDLWNSQKWQILISVNRDLGFFLFSEIIFFN